MNDVPPIEDQPDDLDEHYRRASALDPSRPSESVRQAVLAHAAQVAAKRATGNESSKVSSIRPLARRAWQRPAIFGTLAAAALAGVLIAPQFLAPRAPVPLPSQAKVESVAKQPSSVPIDLSAEMAKPGVLEPTHAPTPGPAQAPAPTAPTAPTAPAALPPPRPALSLPAGPALPPPRTALSSPAAPTLLPPPSALEAPVAQEAAAPPSPASESKSDARVASGSTDANARAGASASASAGASAGTGTVAGGAMAGAGQDGTVAGGAVAGAGPGGAVVGGTDADLQRAPGSNSAATNIATSAPRVSALTAQAALAEDPPAALRRSAETGDLQKLKTLLDEQVEIDSRDASGRTALMLATLHDQADAVNALLAHGADPNAADTDGTTPLQVAVAGNRSAIVAALKRNGAR